VKLEVLLFDWGTYNSSSTSAKSATLGMKLTEIPADFSRKGRGPEYFESYKEFASKAFTTITAHAPYYNVVSDSEMVRQRVLKAMKAAIRNAALAGAEVFNLYLGWKVYGRQEDVDLATDSSFHSSYPYLEEH